MALTSVAPIAAVVDFCPFASATKPGVVEGQIDGTAVAPRFAVHIAAAALPLLLYVAQ